MPRQRAWRNIHVTAINAGLDQNVIGLRMDENHFLNHEVNTWMYDFEFPDEIPARASVRTLSGNQELRFEVAVYPDLKVSEVPCYQLGLRASEAVVIGFFELECGPYLMKDTSNKPLLRCRRHLLPDLANTEIGPKGYDDIGPEGFIAYGSFT